MSVCDEKITKLKERIDSELPIYSKEQIKRSKELSFDSSLNKRLFIHNIKDFHGKNLFPPKKDLDSLKKVFQDQTEKALMKNKESLNNQKGNTSKENSFIKSSQDFSDEKSSLNQCANNVEHNSLNIANMDHQNILTQKTNQIQNCSKVASERLNKAQTKNKNPKHSCEHVKVKVIYTLHFNF